MHWWHQECIQFRAQREKERERRKKRTTTFIAYAVRWLKIIFYLNLNYTTEFSCNIFYTSLTELTVGWGHARNLRN